MAGSVNKVIIMGNLGKDPEIRNFLMVGEFVIFQLLLQDLGEIKILEKNRKEPNGIIFQFYQNP